MASTRPRSSSRAREGLRASGGERGGGEKGNQSRNHTKKNTFLTRQNDAILEEQRGWGVGPASGAREGERCLREYGTRTRRVVHGLVRAGACARRRNVEANRASVPGCEYRDKTTDLAETRCPLHSKIDGSKTQQIPQIVLRSVGTGEAGRTQPRRSRVRSSSGCPIRRRAPPPALPDAHVARRRDGESRANLGAPSMRREMVRLPLRASDARARPPDAPIRGVRVETTTPTPPPAPSSTSTGRSTRARWMRCAPSAPPRCRAASPPPPRDPSVTSLDPSRVGASEPRVRSLTPSNLGASTPAARGASAPIASALGC